MRKFAISLIVGTGWFLALGFTTTGRAAAEADSGAPDSWQRTGRVTAYDSPRRARYPSITKAADGSLLVLFTRQTQQQETAGLGDLVLVRSTDGGQSWSEGHVVFSAQRGEPRAVGTMTTLKSGRIIVPLSELDASGSGSTVGMLSSDDGGTSWHMSRPDWTVPLAWWAPCGKLIETADGTLVMPVYGAETQTLLKATIHNCGLLRSGDGGKTWGDFSWIVRGRRSVVGAAARSRFSFEGPSVQPLADGRWLAMVTARRLNKAADGPTEIDEGPGAPQVLCRLYSSDQGRTWSAPDQLGPGVWPSLTRIGRYTMCVNTLWAAWGEMRLVVSRDGFATFYQQAPLSMREWVRGMSNRPQETPPPPTVPYLALQWPFEHYGFPSALPLDDDNLIVVFGRTQRGTGQVDGPEQLKIPYDKERIQAVFYRRTTIEGTLAGPPPTEPVVPRGRWVLAERIIVGNVGAMAQMPDGQLVGYVGGRISQSADGGRTWHVVDGARLPGDGTSVAALGVLSTGRWLAARVQENTPVKIGTRTRMGIRGGYPIFKERGTHYDWSVVVSYSDDQGKSWHEGKPFNGPFKWALPTVSHFIEGRDGVVALPIFGCVTDEEVSSYSSSNVVIRSGDGGETWGDWSFVFRTRPQGPNDFQSEPRYSEMDIVTRPNGHWIAFSRNENLTQGPAGWGSTDVAISTDLGRSWRKTGGSLVGVSQQKGVALPDGGIAIAYRSHSWQAPGVVISYDEGRSFRYSLAGPYETVNAFAHGTDEFLIFTAKSHRSDMSAAVYRWVPH